MIPHVRSLYTVFCVTALAAGCGGADAPTKPEPTPNRRLVIDFAYVEVIQDCDGLEGDGDFQFEVIASPSNGSPEIVYAETVSLAPGGRGKGIGQRGYTFEPVGQSSLRIQFTASELDQSVFGVLYPDERLDNASRWVSYVWGDTGWTGKGRHEMTIGSADCMVRLHYEVLP